MAQQRLNLWKNILSINSMYEKEADSVTAICLILFIDLLFLIEFPIILEERMRNMV